MKNNSHLPDGQKTRELSRDLTANYDRFKDFEGKKYTGMKVGRGHKWYYDQGEWKEKKLTPDKWEFSYAVVKRRAGKAPEGSGVPVGTEYHWYILAHQTVKKLNANDYTTAMNGVKFKLAHKRADKDTWSASDRAQRKRLIAILTEMLQELEKRQTEEERKPRRKSLKETTPSRDGRMTPLKKKSARAKGARKTAA